jgi:hypothetical protein
MLSHFDKKVQPYYRSFVRGIQRKKKCVRGIRMWWFDHRSGTAADDAGSEGHDTLIQRRSQTIQ